MQAESGKRSKYIFQVVLDQQQLTKLLQLDADILKQFLKRCAKNYLKIMDKNIKHVFVYLANLKHIMELHSKVKANHQSVNLCLHFALVFSQYLIRDGRQTQAKKVLRQTQQYSQQADSNRMLQAISFNNLSTLYKKRQMYKRSLQTSLKGISIIQYHLQRLFLAKDKKRIIEDGIIYVNLLAISQSCLKQLINREQTHQASHYRKLLKVVVKLGYNFSKKYYGEDSFFTKKFNNNADASLILPILFDQSISEPSVDEKDQFVQKISNELQNIYKILQELRVQPQVYYVNIIQAQSSIVEPQPEPKPQPQFRQQDIIYVQNVVIGDWDVQISFIKQKQDPLNVLYQSCIQNLQFRLQKQNKKARFFISRQKMIKIINVINYYDILPYESCIGSFDKHAFIRKFLLYFMRVDQEGQLNIYPKAIPIVQVFQYTFLNEPSLIFIYHIHFRKFRIAINIIKSTEPYYIDFQLKQKEFKHLFILNQIQHKFINQQSRKYHPEAQYQPSTYKYHPFKIINLVSPQLFKAKVVKILMFLQQFLKQQEENEISELTSIYDIVNSYCVNYFHYVQFEENIGQIYQVKHKINSNYVEINMKNVFKTYGIDKVREEAKGNILYSPVQFYKDFGIHLRHVLRYILVFFQIILQKYFLKIYEKPLTNQQENIFDLNSIAELPFVSKCFFRKFLIFEKLISLNGEKPIGIRVSAYQPIKGTHSGIFIHVVPEYWQKPPLKHKQVTNSDERANQKLKKTTNDYSFKKNYFLANWLQDEGFKIIFKHVAITNRILEIKGVGNKFILLDQILALN